MLLPEILQRIENVLNQLMDKTGVDTESQALDLLRHDLENEIIEEDNVNEKLKEENAFLQKDSLSMLNRVKELSNDSNYSKPDWTPKQIQYWDTTWDTAILGYYSGILIGILF